MAKDTIKHETRQLKMHESLLWSVIHRQAGTIGKALLEGVMNSVDAGATECRIELDRDYFEVHDDGKGFASDQEIEDFFETFGTPHEEGDAVYGRFRMGRGQMMAFGANVWHTNNYKMVVDLKPQQGSNAKNQALGYDFYKIDENSPGCHIRVDLYDKLSPSGLDSVLREVRESMKYVQIPVYLNGKLISIDPATEAWDEVTEDAYIRRKGGGTLDIYNLGVLVTKQSQYIAGASGVVVAKKALEVNFARNAVQSSCPVWRRVLKVLKDENIQALKRRTPLTDVQRDFFATQLVSGELSFDELGDNRIVTDVTNSHHPLSIFSRLGKYHNKVSVAKRGDRVAEMAHTRKLAFVVEAEMAARFNAETAEELVEAVKNIYAQNGRDVSVIQAVDRAEFEKVISSNHIPIKDSELNKAERLALTALRAASVAMARAGALYDLKSDTQTFSKSVNNDFWWNQKGRKISLGASDTAQAWTDGVNNIWFERRQLKLIKEGMPGMVRLANLMLHEYLHNEPSTNTHEHGVEFYSRHHDINLDSDVVTKAANAMMKSVIKSMRTDDKVLTQAFSTYEDTVTHAAEKGLGKSLDDIQEEVEIPVDVPKNSQKIATEAMPAVPDRKPTANKKKSKEVESEAPQLVLSF